MRSPNTYRFLLLVFCIVNLYSVGTPSVALAGRLPLMSGLVDDEADEGPEVLEVEAEGSLRMRAILGWPSAPFLCAARSCVSSAS